MQRAQCSLFLWQACWTSAAALLSASGALSSAALEPGEWLVRFQGHGQRSQTSDRLLRKVRTSRTNLHSGRYIDNAYLVRADSYVRIPKWYGRLGNNLHQVFHAIVYAESQNITEVRNPSTGGPLAALFNLPTRFDVQPRLLSKADCSFVRTYFSYEEVETCVLGYAKEDFRRALLTYMKPHLKREVREVCQSKHTASHDLVIHLRGGDLRNAVHPQGRMQPCSFYRHLITAHNFSSVKLVVQDGEHDQFCRKYILTTFYGSKVRVKETDHTFIDDACTLMTSQYLAFGLSSFPETLSMMNDQIKKIYVPALKYNGNGDNGKGDIQYGSETDLAGTVECGGHYHACSTGFIEYELYDIPGFDKIRRDRAKREYLLQEEMGYSHLKTCGHCVV